jgi:hypothetical protein
MSIRTVANFAFYGLLGLLLIYRSFSIFKSDMFSLDVFINSFISLKTSSGKEYDLMKVSRPDVRPLQPPPLINSAEIHREEL